MTGLVWPASSDYWYSFNRLLNIVANSLPYSNMQETSFKCKIVWIKNTLTRWSIYMLTNSKHTNILYFSPIFIMP